MIDYLHGALISTTQEQAKKAQSDIKTMMEAIKSREEQLKKIGT